MIEEIKNKDDLKKMLVWMGNIDCDFNEYLWDEAWIKEYLSNAEYLADVVVDNYDRDTFDEEFIVGCAGKFAEEWANRDHHYTKIEVLVKRYRDTDIYAFSINAVYND
jgi:hypothetical protein